MIDFEQLIKNARRDRDLPGRLLQNEKEMRPEGRDPLQEAAISSFESAGMRKSSPEMSMLGQKISMFAPELLISGAEILISSAKMLMLRGKKSLFFPKISIFSREMLIASANMLISGGKMNLFFPKISMFS